MSSMGLLGLSSCFEQPSGPGTPSSMNFPGYLLESRTVSYPTAPAGSTLKSGSSLGWSACTAAAQSSVAHPGSWPSLPESKAAGEDLNFEG